MAEDITDNITDADDGQQTATADPGLSGSLTPDDSGTGGPNWDQLLEEVSAGKDGGDKPADKPAKDADKPAKDADKPADKPAKDADKPAAKDGSGKPADKPDRKDELDDIQLPPGKSGATRESFEKLKTVSREKIAAAEKARDDAKAEAEELKKQLSAGPDPTLVKELEEHRQWRAKIDVESSPEIKAFSKRIETNEKIIVSKLKEAGMNDDQIKKAQEIGLKDLNWEPIFAHLTPQAKNLIIAKLAENESATFDRDEALKQARGNIQEYLAQQDVNSKETMKREANELIAHTEAIIKGQDWFYKKEIPAGATAEQKATLEKHNKLAGEAVEMLKEAFGDRSIRMKAMLACGTIKALHLATQLEDAQAQIEALKKELEEKDGYVAKVKKASAATGSKPAADGRGAAKDGVFKEGRIKSTDEALDDLLKEVSED